MPVSGTVSWKLKRINQMTNKYLEKIAKEISKDEKKSRSAAWGTLGRSAAGSILGTIPGAAVQLAGLAKGKPGLAAIGSVAGTAGGVYGAIKGYKSGIRKHAPNVKEQDLQGHATRGYARQLGRSYAEGAGGAIGGGAVGAGVGALAAKVMRKSPKIGAAIGGYAGLITGGPTGTIHGAYKSTKNKLDELNGKKK